MRGDSSGTASFDLHFMVDNRQGDANAFALCCAARLLQPHQGGADDRTSCNLEPCLTGG